MSKVQVKIPGYVKDIAMMSSIMHGGKKDRTYIKAMGRAIHSYHKKRNENLRKLTKDLSSED